MTAGLIPHLGVARAPVFESERTANADIFTGITFDDPFNRLVADTVPPCVGRWDIFCPAEGAGERRPNGRLWKQPAHRKAEAAALCATCPIQTACLAKAMEPGERGGAPDAVGIYAGTDEADRLAMHRAARAV